VHDDNLVHAALTGTCAHAAALPQILKHAALSSNLAGEEPIDVVMHNCYPGKDTLWSEYTLKKFVPFNPVDKYTIAIVTDNKTGRAFRVMKGAPQVRGTPVHSGPLLLLLNLQQQQLLPLLLHGVAKVRGLPCFRNCPRLPKMGRGVLHLLPVLQSGAQGCPSIRHALISLLSQLMTGAMVRY
jgi:hypothetical protein